MVIDREFEEFPYTGRLSEYIMEDNLSFNDRRERENVILEFECDIHEASRTSMVSNITATYSVYFPIDRSKLYKVRRGLTFRGSKDGLIINGEVLSVDSSQLGYCVIHIKDLEV